MSYRPWYNDETNYQTNSKSYMDYLGRVNKFLEVVIEDYEVFQETLLADFKNHQFNANLELLNILQNWANDGTLSRIINEEIFNGKADTVYVENRLQDMQNILTVLEEKLLNDMSDLDDSLTTEIETFKTFVMNHFETLENEIVKKLEDYELVNVKEFNVVGNGSTDDTENLKAAILEAKQSKRTLYIPNGVYAVNGIVFDTPFQLGNSVTFKYNGELGGTLVGITVDNIHVDSIRLDGDNKSCTLLRQYGSNNKFGFIHLENIELENVSPNHCFGMFMTGNNNQIDFIRGTHLKNINYRNESFPQSVLNEGHDNVIGTIQLNDVASGLVTNPKGEETTLLRVNNLYVENASDNGIYNLSRSSLHLDNYFYHGKEEPAVFTGKDIFINSFRVKGQGSRIGFQNVDNVRINKLHLELDEQGNGLNAIFRTRESNTKSGSISIGEISGELVSHVPGCQFMLFDKGEVDYLSIDRIDVVHIYKGTKSDLARWFYLNAVKQFKINDVTVKIVDLEDRFTASDQFDMTLPQPIKQSFINRVQVEIVNGDGATPSVASFRGYRFKQEMVRSEQVTMQTNVGPYARERKYGNLKTMNGIPTTGYWHKGEVYYNSHVTEDSPNGWICIESGSPGTWKVI